MSNKVKLIKASAGSGKTFDLMNRLSQCIKDGIEPENLLATTFTVKAAAELQSRIRRKLIEDGKPELAGRVFDGLIGTVDGICGRLLSEYAIEAGLSPALDVLAEEDSSLIFDASLSEVYKANNSYAEKIDAAANRIGMPIYNKKTNRNINRNTNQNTDQNTDWKDDVKKVTEIARNNKLGKKDLKDCADQSINALKTVLLGNQNYSLNAIVNEVFPLQLYNSSYDTTQKTVKEIKNFIKYPLWSNAAKVSKCSVAGHDDDFEIDTLVNIGERLLDSKQLFDDVALVINGVFDFAGYALETFSKYKESMGLVDFVDQECRTLDLFENNEKFQNLMKDRLAVAMVDEFQDTSPIQLALFLKINECAEKGSIWVGDPKQAIYGFRGTDPELMNTISSSVPKENVSTLEYSWRSKEKLVQLSNEIFTRTFLDMEQKEIVLGIPAERKEKAKGGDVEAWHIVGKNNDERFVALAAAIKEMIEKEGVKPEDIGVLMRSNPSCKSLSYALASLGIPASTSSGSLIETYECRLIMAAFRYCINPKDTAALAVLCAYYGQNKDVLKTIVKEKDSDFQTLRNMPFLKGFEKLKDSTPLEILDYVITSLKIDEIVSCMDYPVKRIQNVEKIKTCCINYMNHAQVSRSSATPGGFISYMSSSALGQAEGFGNGTVNVLTYHKSKGLQWPVVILCSLDSEVKGNAFGTHVLSAEQFDAKNPLAGRSINYWPSLFGGKQKVKCLEERLSNHKFQQSVFEKELEESRRLMYVGITRAESKLIFAIKKNKDKLCLNWLDNLSDNPFMKFPEATGNGKLKVGTESFDIITKEFDSSCSSEPVSAPSHYIDDYQSNGKIQYPASMFPSSVEATDGKTELLFDFSSTMNVSVKNDEYDLIGNAIHNYIAINPKDDKVAFAEKLLRNWTVSDSVKAQDVVDSSDRLYEWIDKTYPDAKIECEVPMTYTDEHGTFCQGYIDMLVETNEGIVIIDHKTHGNAMDAESYAASCIGQLRLYKRAVEESLEKKVLQLIIHMPVLGKLYKVW